MRELSLYEVSSVGGAGDTTVNGSVMDARVNVVTTGSMVSSAAYYIGSKVLGAVEHKWIIGAVAAGGAVPLIVDMHIFEGMEPLESRLKLAAYISAVAGLALAAGTSEGSPIPPKR